MPQHVFIRTNNKQLLGAWLATYAIMRSAKDKAATRVALINVDEIAAFRAFEGRRYRHYDQIRTYALSDLQSFTLSAFMAPQLAGYEGRAMVIDPDVFVLGDVGELFARDLKGKALAARPKRGHWDTSVMLLDCARLRHWDIERILSDMAEFKTTYQDWMSLKNEQVDDLEPEWNSWDTLAPETRALHTTNRLTQPWRTGLPVDFTRNTMPKLFGVIPREWIARLRGKIPSRYQPHPDKKIEAFFFGLVKDALADGAVTEGMIRSEIAAGHVRADLFERIA